MSMPTRQELERALGGSWHWDSLSERWEREVMGVDVSVWMGRCLHISFNGEVFGQDPDDNDLDTLADEFREHLAEWQGYWADMLTAFTGVK